MDCTKWKEDIDKAIANVCVQIIKEPLIYFSEADIQQLLAEALRRIPELKKLYPTSVHKGKGSKGIYKTSLLHREYGGSGGTRIDIVIFDPDDVKKIDDVNLKIGKEYITPAYAFELGTEKSSDTAEHYKNDFLKLQKMTEGTGKNGTGYLIHFYKDVTQAKIGTKSHMKTEEKISSKYKQVFNAVTNENTNVKILAFLLRTYKNQEKMRGKCEFFNGKEWVKTNVNRNQELKNAILEQLK